jgi:short subunit dehydrogenase-like uncharacterized protein
MSTRSRDVVAFGATSFVGKILSSYLLEEFGTHGKLKWAAAGRSKTRLQELRDSLGTKAAKLPLVVADAADGPSLRKLCASTRVVVSTVGPYALHGEPLVRACAESGTDYCDLTGEVQWIRRMLQRYEATARESGARIVHCCGFDSIPSDMGVYFLQREARSRSGAPCTRIKMRVKAMRGGFSGGTVASLMNLVKEASVNPALRKELADPYSLCPAGSAPAVRQPEVRSAQLDPDFGAWVAPFLMGAINTRIVHRTNALSGHAWPASWSRVRSTPFERHSSASCCPSPARVRAPRRSARASSTCASSERWQTAVRSAARSRATATRATARPARCWARPRRASHSMSTRPPRPVASGRQRRSSAIDSSSGSRTTPD